MKIFLIRVGGVLTILLLSTVALSQNKWDELATRSVDRTLDRDVILVTSGNIYTALKLTVEEGSVNIYKTTLHYKSGDVENVKFPEVASKSNGDSIVNLIGNKRVIEKITFWYDTQELCGGKGCCKDMG